jgi:molybdenum cofactor cytidylyltransferase
MMAAVRPAAGLSLRMGRPKLLLPWGEGQIILGHLVHTLHSGGASPMRVIPGSDHTRVEAARSDVPVRCLCNPDFVQGGMLPSIKLGLQSLQSQPLEAAMLAPADLPWLPAETLRRLAQEWECRQAPVLVPSRRSRRGHPLVVARGCWPGIRALRRDETLGDFLQINPERLADLEVNDPGTGKDIDAPDDDSDKGSGGLAAKPCLPAGPRSHVA